MFDRFFPLLGVKWSRMDLIHWIDDNRNRKKSDLDKSIGAICGFDLFLNDKTWITVEGHFLDSEAVSASLNFEF